MRFESVLGAPRKQEPFRIGDAKSALGSFRRHAVRDQPSDDFVHESEAGRPAASGLRLRDDLALCPSSTGILVGEQQAHDLPRLIGRQSGANPVTERDSLAPRALNMQTARNVKTTVTREINPTPTVLGTEGLYPFADPQGRQYADETPPGDIRPSHDAMEDVRFGIPFHLDREVRLTSSFELHFDFEIGRSAGQLPTDLHDSETAHRPENLRQRLQRRRFEVASSVVDHGSCDVHGTMNIAKIVNIIKSDAGGVPRLAPR
jgi:hypothetical protein